MTYNQKQNLKGNIIVTLILAPFFIGLAIIAIPAFKCAIEVDKTCTAVPIGWGEYDFIPNFFMEGQENIHLTKLKNDLCNEFFKNPSREWYRGDMDGSMVQIKLCDNMNKDDEIYSNGTELCNGKYIAINKDIMADRIYNTKDLLEKGGNRETTSLVLHELIHCYVAYYYPNSELANLNHRGIYREIEQDLINQGVYLNQNYIRTSKELKAISKKKVNHKR